MIECLSNSALNRSAAGKGKGGAPRPHYGTTKMCRSGIPYLYLFFYSVLRPFKSYFSSYETGQSVGGAKTGEKPPDTPSSRTWLVSHVARAGLEPTPVTAVR